MGAYITSMRSTRPCSAHTRPLARKSDVPQRLSLSGSFWGVSSRVFRTGAMGNRGATHRFMNRRGRG